MDATSPWCERLNPTDATFLYLESPKAHMHVGAVFLYQGHPPSYREFVEYVTSRLDLVPRYRQRLAWIPFDAGRPVWVDDDRFDPEYHLKHSALPGAGGPEALKRAAARIFGQPLDLERPLWELELVENVGEDRFAIVSKTHHAVIDGIAGNSVVTAITDDTPTFGTSGFASEWRPRPRPGSLRLLAGALRDQVTRPLQLAREALRSGTEGRRFMIDLVVGIRPFLRLALQGQAPETSLNADIGAHRRYEMVSVSLDAVKRIRAAVPSTVNDVALALVAGALRRLLVSRGEPLRDDLRVFVPVNARPPDQTGSSGNEVAFVFCPLPLAESDPIARLRAISAAMMQRKQAKDAAASLVIARLGEFTVPALAASATRMETNFRRFNFVVSNVPGSPTPRYFLGRRMLALHPLIPLSALQTLSVGLHSYAGTICFGLLADADRGRDLPIFARAIPEALAELVRATGTAAELPPPTMQPARVAPFAARATVTTERQN